MSTEAHARIKINKLLEEAGWRLVDTKKEKANIILEGHTSFDELGEDFEKTQYGFIDYLLLDQRNFPLCVLEAKSEDKDPLVGEEQARDYARSKNARFIILSNGNLHYFWDLDRGNPTVITSLPTQESLKHFEAFRPNPLKLTEEDIKEDYIAVTQKYDYSLDPRWKDESQRKEFINEKGLKFLRLYQMGAIKALQDSAQIGNTRFLFEMATGTGKTLVSAAVIKLFLKTGNVSRVLFLVDRIELENQAWKNFVRYLKNDYTCVIYKEKKNNWHNAEIVVSTVQSLSFDNKYKKIFSPTDFDLIISDEAHRSISGNSRAVFEYFVGYKLGLTATPKDYLRNIDSEQLNPRDVRAWERRQLFDTYKTFGCESAEPTFRYSLIDGFKDGFLINPIVSDARTEITTQLLSDEGYSVMVETEEGEDEELNFTSSDYERKFFSKRTNEIFCKTFLENALKDPISGEIGKTIVFCVSQKHASKITQILNQFAHQLYPNKYNSDFAIQVTSFIQDAQQFSTNFANNNLRGHSRFLEGYKSSKTRVCVTVGMMTTGYDCEDILNICLMRPIFSPTDFIQIKGRGTRKFNFEYKCKEDSDIRIYKEEKKHFKLFDFFANCEFFEEHYNYDEVLTLPPRTGSGGTGGGETPKPEEVTVTIPDPLTVFEETAVGPDGMRIDREFYHNFEQTIREDSVIKENFKKGNIDFIENYIINEIFDKPEEFYNLAKLRKAVNADRRIPLREFIEKIFGIISGFKSKDELLNEEFGKFVSIYKPDSKYIMVAKNYFKAYITEPEFRNIIDQREYALLNTYAGFSMAEFTLLNHWRNVIPEYIMDYVNLNKYSGAA